MRWSLTIGSVAGIRIRVHASMLLLAVWWFTSHALRQATPQALFIDSLLLIVVFAIIVAHELGHALTARRYGIRTADITLLPFGGVARLERLPENPWPEMWVALAGPLVNGVLAVAFGLLAYAELGSNPLLTLDLTTASLAAKLMWINIGMSVFNLVPAFPLDGGRIFRALLSLAFGRVRATDIAGRIGEAMAFALGVAGLFVNPLWIFMALFLWSTAEAEMAMVHRRAAAAPGPEIPAEPLLYQVLTPWDTLGSAVRAAHGTPQQDFPVMAGGAIVGVIRTEALWAAQQALGPDARIADALLALDQPVSKG